MLARTPLSRVARRSIIYTACIATIAICAVTTPATDAAQTRRADFDSSFGNRGVVTIPSSIYTLDGAGGGDFAPAAAAPDGGFGILGVHRSRVILIRLNRDGHRERRFGNRGITAVADAAGSKYVPLSQAFDSKRRALVLFSERDSKKRSSVRLVRLRANGTLDRTFGASGSLRFAVNRFTRVYVSEPSRILLASRPDAEGSDKNRMPELLALNEAGQPDFSFAGGLFKAAPCPDLSQSKRRDDWFEIETSVRGTLLATRRCGEGPTRLMMIRPDGEPGGDLNIKTSERTLPQQRDGEFHYDWTTTSGDASGHLYLSGQMLYSVAQPGGAPLWDWKLLIARVGRDGSLDSTFGHDGTLTARQAGAKGFGEWTKLNLSALPDGRLYIYKSTTDGENVNRTLVVSGSVVSPSGRVLAEVPFQRMRNPFFRESTFSHTWQPRAVFYYGLPAERNGHQSYVLQIRRMVMR